MLVWFPFLPPRIGMQKRFKLFICRVNGTHIEVEAQLLLLCILGIRYAGGELRDGRETPEHWTGSP